MGSNRDDTFSVDKLMPMECADDSAVLSNVGTPKSDWAADMVKEIWNAAIDKAAKSVDCEVKALVIKGLKI